MPEFTIGDSVIYTPSFGVPKSVIVLSSPDGSGYMDIQFVDADDFAEFRDMGISEVVVESERIGRVPEASLSFTAPEYEERRAPQNNAQTNVQPNAGNAMGGRRRRRPSSRSRRRRSSRRRSSRLSRRH